MSTTPTTKLPPILSVNRYTNLAPVNRPSWKPAQQVSFKLDRNFNQLIRQLHHTTRLSHSFSHTSTRHYNTNTNHSFLRRTITPHRSSNSGPTTERSNRESITSTIAAGPGILQLNVRHPKEKRRSTPSIQPQEIEPILGCPPFQNGNYSRSISHGEPQRLPRLHRSVRRVFTCRPPPRLTPIPATKMEESGVSVLYNRLWPILQSLCLHQSLPTNLGTLPFSGIQDISLSRRLDFSSKLQELAMQQVQQVVDLLQHLGWIVNGKKSVLNPTQQLEHLGYILNTQTMTASLPLKKLRDIRRSIKQVLDKPHRQSPRVIHSLTMRIQAATFAIFPARLYTRHLIYYKNQMVKNDRDFDLPRPLDKASLDELNWWYLNLQKWNGRSLLPTTPTQTIFVDASNTGWGCSWKTYRAHGYWTTQEAAQSINWRELKAAHLALTTFQVPQNSTILIRTDNTTSLSYINKQGGTRSLPLMELATEVWNWCLANNIHIQAQHIRGIHNNIADMESRRTFFKNQWQLKPKAFQTINHLWGPHSIDLFADRTTKLLPKYVSWMPDPGAIHTDAFTIPWNIWTRPFANPPWNLISRTLRKIIQEQISQITIVVPHWPSAIWFPLLQRLALCSPLLLTPLAIRTTSPKTVHPLQHQNWTLSVWKLSGLNW